MSKLYFVAFRLEDNTTRQKRYNELEGALAEASGGLWWKDPTSFIVFRSDLNIDQVAAFVSAAIDEDTDIAVIGMPEVKSARVVGVVEDDDLFKLWDWITPA